MKFLFATGCIFLFVNCSTDKDVTEELVGITLQFSHSWEETEVSNTDFGDLKFSNENGEMVSIELLRYLISEFSVMHESGKTTIFDNYNLVDVTNNRGLSFTLSDAILPGNYTSVTCRFGFSADKNIDGGYPDLNTANFNVPELFGGGYHHMQFDGSYRNADGIEAPFNYHVINAIDPTKDEDPVDTSIVLNLGVVTIGKHTTLHIQMDLSEWFKNPNTWNLNHTNIHLMGNYSAQMQMNQNGASVFRLLYVTQ